jgi:TetR/AcrR family transcriptional regulator
VQSSAKKKVKKSRNATKTRQSILDAGLRLFAERGFAGATIEQIARRAGVNKALVSYYFGSKRGLQDAIHAEAFRHLEPRLLELRRSTAPAEERLREFIDTLASLAEANPDYPVMILRGLIEDESDAHEAFASRVLELNQILVEILHEGQRNGRLRPVDPLTTQVNIVGSVLFFFATQSARERLASSGKLPARPPIASDFVTHLGDLVERGLATGADSSSGAER